MVVAAVLVSQRSKLLSQILIFTIFITVLKAAAGGDAAPAAEAAKPKEEEVDALGRGKPYLTQHIILT